MQQPVVWAVFLPESRSTGTEAQRLMVPLPSLVAVCVSAHCTSAEMSSNTLFFLVRKMCLWANTPEVGAVVKHGSL